MTFFRRNPADKYKALQHVPQKLPIDWDALVRATLAPGSERKFAALIHGVQDKPELAKDALALAQATIRQSTDISRKRAGFAVINALIPDHPQLADTTMLNLVMTSLAAQKDYNTLQAFQVLIRNRPDLAEAAFRTACEKVGSRDTKTRREGHSLLSQITAYCPALEKDGYKLAQVGADDIDKEVRQIAAITKSAVPLHRRALYVFAR